MISKETFVKTINDLKSLDDRMDAVYRAFKNLNPDFCGFYVTEVFDVVLDLLAEAMDDEEEWISYFVYDRNWLKDFNIGDVEVHGVPVVINSWEDVYDFIVEGR